MSMRVGDAMVAQLAELRHEPTDKRIRGRAGDETVVDCKRALLVWEPRRVVPDYAVREEDVRAELLPAEPAPPSDAPILHPLIPFSGLSDRSVRIELDGDVIAESARATFVYETRLPTRFYLPREDVSVALQASARRTYCPYKGEASYWSLDGSDDVAWSYEQPLPDMVAITGLVAFWDERVDVFLDGERRTPPGGAIADALRDEFDV